MEKISYSERSRWYQFETYDPNQNSFLHTLMSQNNWKNPVIIPCSSGKNLQVLSSVSQSVMAYDIDTEMIIQAKRLVLAQNLKNVKINYGSLLDFDIPQHSDVIFILNEALQMFSPRSNDYSQILGNISKKYYGSLVLELYDFHNDKARDSLRYYSYKRNGEIVRDLTFICDNKSITRFHKSFRTDEGVRVIYYYKCVNMANMTVTWKKTSFELFDINSQQLVDLISLKNNVLVNVYTSYTFAKNPIEHGKKVIVLDIKR